MKGVLIGTLLALIGYMTQNFLLIVLGIFLAVIIVIFDKPSKINYEYVDVKPKHIVMQGPPPKDKWPTPEEIQAPFGKAIYQKEIVPLEKEVKKLKINLIATKNPVTKKMFKKKLEKAEKKLDKKMDVMAALPFGIQKKKTHPVSKMFHGLGVNLSVKLFKKLYDDKE